MQHAPPSDAAGHNRWLLLLLIVLCCLIEGALHLTEVLDIAPRIRAAVYEYGAFWPAMLADWPPLYAAQPYVMFLTYGFLHGGLLHLGLNMITLWSLGQPVLERAGSVGFLLIYFVTMVGGVACYTFLALSPAPVVGASGALFGLVGALLSWSFTDRRAAGESLLIVVGIICGLVILNLALWWFSAGQLAWQAHLGGFVAGWFLAQVIRSEPEPL